MAVNRNNPLNLQLGDNIDPDIGNENPEVIVYDHDPEMNVNGREHADQELQVFDLPQTENNNPIINVEPLNNPGNVNNRNNLNRREENMEMAMVHEREGDNPAGNRDDFEDDENGAAFENVPRRRGFRGGNPAKRDFYRQRFNPFVQVYSEFAHFQANQQANQFLLLRRAVREELAENRRNRELDNRRNGNDDNGQMRQEDDNRRIGNDNGQRQRENNRGNNNNANNGRNNDARQQQRGRYE